MIEKWSIDNSQETVRDLLLKISNTTHIFKWEEFSLYNLDKNNNIDLKIDIENGFIPLTDIGEARQLDSEFLNMEVLTAFVDTVTKTCVVITGDNKNIDDINYNDLFMKYLNSLYELKKYDECTNLISEELTNKNMNPDYVAKLKELQAKIK